MSSFPKSAFVGAALLACALTAPAFAAVRSAVAVTAHRSDASAVRAQRSMLLAPRGIAAAATTSSGLTASSYRAYPASCFSDTLPTPANAIQPLPVTPSGELYQQTVTLYEYDSVNKVDSAEDVTITIFRVACSSSRDKLDYNPDGGYVGATLMRIQRQAQYEGDSQLYPQFPDIRIAQGNIAFDNANLTDYVRVAVEPNTILSDVQVGAPVINSMTYVLENYPSPDRGFFYLNNAFTIRFDNGYQNGQTTIAVPDYVPTQQAYPVAFKPMAINGYLTGVWGAPPPSIGSREGILTQVLDGSDGATRTFLAYWYTYDSLGLPFWLFAQASFPIGATQLLNVPVYYTTGGNFAATTPPSPPVVSNPWGTLNVSFSDCQHIQIDYNGATGTLGNGLGGSGTLKWTRLSGSNINNLVCQ